MKIYRAMCEKEAKRTLSRGSPDFIKRFKWFSSDISFIKFRVQDGNFNNSNAKTDRYTRIFEFEVIDTCKHLKVSDKELQFDRRDNPKIILIREVSSG